ncbi:hypothetical protein LSAT2_017500 [Lamellibrachia satsuma]|nr:hypothetical protein LSAT2_017500 [Lamellibrachia satsuma]
MLPRRQPVAPSSTCLPVVNPSHCRQPVATSSICCPVVKRSLRHLPVIPSSTRRTVVNLSPRAGSQHTGQTSGRHDEPGSSTTY